MTSAEFWGMTLRQFTLLGERRREELKRADRRAGEVVAMLYNINRGEKADAIEWSDVFPEWKEPRRQQTEDQMLVAMQMWAAATKHLPS